MFWNQTNRRVVKHTPSKNGEVNVCIMLNVIFRVHYGSGTNTVGFIVHVDNFQVVFIVGCICFRLVFVQ